MCLVIGCPGAMSIIVRAMAERSQRIIGRGLDDDVAARDRIAEDRHRGDGRDVARNDVHGARGPKARTRSSRPSRKRVRDPSVEVVQPDLGVGDFGDVVPGEQRPQNAIAVLQHLRRQHVGHQRGFVGLLQVGVRCRSPARCRAPRARRGSRRSSARRGRSSPRGFSAAAARRTCSCPAPGTVRHRCGYRTARGPR